MPIKFPKAFGNRKSSGNVLENVEPAPVQSFRVLESHDAKENSFGGATVQLKRRSAVLARGLPITRQSPEYSESGAGANRGSDGTHKSTSTGRWDDTSSSARLSRASTTPSSIEYDSQSEDVPEYPQSDFSPGIRSVATMSIPPAATISYQRPQNPGASSSGPNTPNSAFGQDARQRSVTGSSYASTATPPKMEFADDLAWMSDVIKGLGDPASSTFDEPPRMGVSRTESEPTLVVRSQPSASRFDHVSPAQHRVGQIRALDSSPYSWRSRNSRDGLLSSPPPVPQHAESEEKAPLRRSDSIQSDETESQLLRDSLRASTLLDESNGFENQNIQASGLESDRESNSRSASREDEGLFASANSARLQQRISRNPIGRKLFGKSMTQAEFERMRQQPEAAEPGDQEDDDEGDTYEDDDEIERNRQASKQRRRQSAHLAIYRQQMKKVTGEQPSDFPDVSQIHGMGRAGMSTASLPLLSSTGNDWGGLGGKSSDDDDDEIPLGVLQAHGFPGKNRPPTRPASSHPALSLQASSKITSYPPPPGSTRNDAAAGGGGNVPVFARKLPANVDPYLGAGVVNHPDRASMAFSQSGQPRTPLNVPGNLPAGGLVGIIDQEQRERMSRRGSPNTQGTYAPLDPMMPYGMQSPMNSGDPSQMQMAQFQQMMQMQMQMMQQMMAMQGGLSPQQQQMLQQQQQLHQQQQMTGMPFEPQPLAQSHMLAPLEPPQPFSIPSQASSVGGRSRVVSSMSQPSSQQWTPSFGGSLLPGGNQPRGYAPSIAPSERSNVGQPSRYRPVTATEAISSHPHSRASTLTSTIVGFQSKVRAVSKPKYGAGSDDEDEEGWAEMRKRREQRKSRWRRSESVAPSTTVPEGAYYLE